MKAHFIILLVTVVNCCYSQTELGISLMNQGDYLQAIEVFKKSIDEDPDNKTSQICYGRAVGLSGSAPEAVAHFENLSKIYKADTEVLLNLAESYLWNNNAIKAKPVYENILKINPTEFSALFGLANTLSNLSKNKEALSFIDKALEISATNQQALISKKYILLGLSVDYREELKLDSALIQIEKILEFFPQDREANLSKGDILLAMNDADRALKTLIFIVDQNIDSIQANINLSYIYLLKKKFNSSIERAEIGVNLSREYSQDHLKMAFIQKVNALAAAKRFKEAKQTLEQIESEIGVSKESLLAHARIKVWAGDFEKGLMLYSQLEETSFESHMGEAEAYLALGEYNSALQKVEDALSIQSNQIDALRFKNKLLESNKIDIKILASSSADIGTNTNNFKGLHLKLPINDNNLIGLQLEHSLFRNTNEFTENETFKLGVQNLWKLSRKLQIKYGLALSRFQDLNKQNQMAGLAQLGLNYKINKSHNISYNIIRDYYNYSPLLTSQGISLIQHQINYQFNKTFFPGLFIQLDKSFQSDGNERNLVFASAFYEINTFPMIKAGVNLNYLSFKEQRNEIYFSPSKYAAAEAFVHFANIYSENKKLKYDLMVAIGQQQIEDNSPQLINRVQANLSYSFTNSIRLNLSYQYNSAASTTLLGYSFQNIGLSANIRL